MDKAYPVLVTDDVATAREFYERHLGLVPGYVTDWFVFLTHPTHDGVSIGLAHRPHESLPRGARVPAAGVLLSLEVPDVDAAYEQFSSAGVPVEVPVRDEPWGQRHFMVQGPDGVYLDVISPIQPTAEYAAAYVTA